MPNLLIDTLAPAATARFVLLANHVLMAAPPAMARLKAHSGRWLRVEVEGWRLPLPPPPPLSLRLTPAGLFEAPEPGEAVPEAVDLRLTVDASDPLAAAKQLASGQIPNVRIEGDVALAADINWVLANVRWDIAADLERVAGPVVAEGASRVAAQLGGVAQSLAQGVASVVAGLGRKP
ncbi:hypothetical protein [Ideonella paludis]|uniref:Ubiquinone biosynthesis protein UbiJ n=1 Tax=Ideonella paludis TaxID=1233411 RepID=A0ABS5DYL1_9BURK|nr:hypothetical protein [Ideonella paludis]MBQ0936232.1 hypothetical protein [Ideonella paludis]